MSVAGLKKQFYKASQLVSEKVGGAEGTKLDDDFKEMEKKVDVTSKAVTEVLARTIEYLQPNPASRAKLTMLNTVSKIRGQVKNPGYPQSEGLLGECMIRHGKELGGESNFGDALLDAGESMKRLAEVKDSLDIEVKQNFIDPLQNLCDKDLKEIQHHLKKLEGRRLDFDYKKKRQGKIPDEELRQAMEKFEESKEVAETSMHNLLETDIEQVSQLSALVDAQLDYHRQAVQILDELADKLKRRMREASSRPKREYKPRPREPLDLGEPEQSNGGFPCTVAPKISDSSSFRSSNKPVRTPSSRSMPPLDQPSCKALYDFEPENDGELGFHEGDIITLTNQIDENWTLLHSSLRGSPSPAYLQMPPPWEGLTSSLQLGAWGEMSLGSSGAESPKDRPSPPHHLGGHASLLQGSEPHTHARRTTPSQAHGVCLSGTSCHHQHTHTHTPHMGPRQSRLHSAEGQAQRL
ncbi:endophilin-A2 isoform X1 [Camelus ferus]|uniref:Endophilin-A2 n=2 Tax=Camelus TaxID=9836 RepID=A0A8B8RWU3_CAMFR|nr:endophilin-A2 isoform X1 [Camelus ferus]